MQKITPFLWFDNNAEEAVNYYTSIFSNAKILKVARYDEEGAKVSGQPEGSVMVISFQVEGQEFQALNGGPMFKFSPATSFLINCRSQEEVDTLWENLSEGGEKQQCGWLQDKFGVSWQVVPTVLDEMLNDPDPDRSKRVMKAMLQMTKIDISLLKQAYEG